MNLHTLTRTKQSMAFTCMEPSQIAQSSWKWTELNSTYLCMQSPDVYPSLKLQPSPLSVLISPESQELSEKGTTRKRKKKKQSKSFHVATKASVPKIQIWSLISSKTWRFILFQKTCKNSSTIPQTTWKSIGSPPHPTLLALALTRHLGWWKDEL